MAALITTPEELEAVVERAVRKVLGERPPQEPPLTSEQAAQELHVKVQTVERWARAGRLHGERQGRRWRFTRADLAAFRRGGDVTGDARRVALELLGSTPGKR